MSDQNKIITLDGKPAVEPTPEPQLPPALTHEVANKIGGAFAKLHELSNAKIQTPTTNAEIVGLKKYLAEAFLVYGFELMGCWFTIRNEYEPLLKTFSTVTERVVGILAATQARRAELVAHRNAADTKE